MNSSKGRVEWPTVKIVAFACLRRAGIVDHSVRQGYDYMPSTRVQTQKWHAAKFISARTHIRR